MSRRKKRLVYFVCSSIQNSKIETQNIPASSKKEALFLYEQERKFAPETIAGPFYIKRQRITKTNRKDLKFSNVTKKAIYKNLIVSAFILNEPTDMAYLVFIKTIEGAACPKMNTTVIVPISELEFI